MKCLIVEDNGELADLWQIALQRDGHEIDRASDLAEATKILRFTRYDIVLLDLMLKGENAISLSTFVGYTSPSARIVVITGSSMYPRGEIFRDAANVAYVLRKPVPLSDLSTCLAHLERTAARQDRPVQHAPKAG
ncbi:MAG: response regulator [Pseudomonadota bacterium]